MGRRHSGFKQLDRIAVGVLDIDRQTISPGPELLDECDVERLESLGQRGNSADLEGNVIDLATVTRPASGQSQSL